MDMFNKLKSTVTGVIPVGNPVNREYEVGAHVASAGPGLFWKVYDAYNRSTKQEASVFMFEKKMLERYSKRDKELILDTLKRGVTQLTKLRHPNILSVLHPLEDSRESLAFATEPVFASLANTLGFHDNMPNPIPPDLEGFKLYDVEIKYGLFQVCEGLGFLHNSVKLVHGNICPHSIVINKTGSWKIAGFDFCIRNANQGDQMPFHPHKEWQTDVPPVTQAQLNYLAPEYALTMSCDTSSDMYSVGVLFYSLFNYGKPVFDARNEWNTYKGNVESLRRLKVSVLGSVPEEVREHIGLLLNTEPSVRPDADQLTKIPFFEDVGAMTLQYLDSLFQRDNLQKSNFFKGLPKILEKLPKRVNLKRILPCLYGECVNKDMVPFLLPCVLLVAKQSSEKEYVKYILPGLLPLLKIKEPIQILLIFMQNMTLLLQKTPQSDIKTHVLPMVYGALESPSPQIQELCLNIIPTFASLVDFTSMKNSLIPRIRKLCLTTTLLNVRVTCLICIGKLLEYMDKWFVLDEILPIMPEIPSREPAVLMSMLGIYKIAMSHQRLGITKDMLSNKVLPFLFPIAIDNNLNLQQFGAYMTVIKEMIEKVETEHRAKLEQLSSMQSEQRTIQIGTIENSSGDSKSGSDNSSGDSMMDKFMSGFGLGSYFGKSNNTKVEAPPAPSAAAPSPIMANGGVMPAMNSIPQPKPADTTLPNQPAKVSLTLEEKTRLARQQQQQQQLKSQQPLNTSMTKNTVQTNQKPPTAGVKDLTSSLLNSNMMSMSSTASTGKTNTGYGGYTGNSSSTVSSFSSASFGTGSNMNMNTASSSMGGFSQNTSKPLNTGTYVSPDTDTSVFDSLLTTSSNKPRQSLNQMGQTNPVQNVGMGMQQSKPMGMSQPSMGMAPRSMGMQSPMGYQARPMGSSMGMMGNSGSMMSSQSMMGNQGNSMMSPSQGMMGGSGMGMMGNQNMMGGSSMGMMGNQGMMGNMNMMGGQNVMGQNKPLTGSKPLSSHDINDLLS